MPTAGDIALAYFDGTRWRTDTELGATPVATYTPAAGLMLGRTGGKIGFLGATPVVQPAGAAQAAVTFTNIDGAIGGLTVSNPPTQAEVVALRDACETLADDCRNLLGLVAALRSALVPSTGLGLIKGSA